MWRQLPTVMLSPVNSRLSRGKASSDNAANHLMALGLWAPAEYCKAYAKGTKGAVSQFASLTLASSGAP
jgi:hypothetical protein